MEKEHWEEWNRMVLDANIDLESRCPLLCDETIILLDKFLRDLKLIPTDE